MTRQPDYVVNVWSDGEVLISSNPTDPAWFLRSIGRRTGAVARVFYRYRIYLKPPITKER